MSVMTALAWLSPWNDRNHWPKTRPDLRSDNDTAFNGATVQTGQVESASPDRTLLVLCVTRVFNAAHCVFFSFFFFITAVFCSYNPSSGRQEKVPELLPHCPVRQRCEPCCGEVPQLLQLESCGDAHTRCPEVLRGQFFWSFFKKKWNMMENVARKNSGAEIMF